MPTKRCDPLSSPTAKRIDPTPEPFRVTRVAVKRSDAIDQIKFTYSDGADWKIGHDGGNADKRELVLTEGVRTDLYALPSPTTPEDDTP